MNRFKLNKRLPNSNNSKRRKQIKKQLLLRRLRDRSKLKLMSKKDKLRLLLKRQLLRKKNVKDFNKKQMTKQPKNRLRLKRLPKKLNKSVKKLRLLKEPLKKPKQMSLKPRK
jgi:hypothetical protein